MRRAGLRRGAASWHSAPSQNLTYEIILTLGQAFEVAYQLALQAQKSRTVAASAASMIETKSSKPVPKPRVGMRKSAVRALPPPRHPRVGWSWAHPQSSHSLAAAPGNHFLQPLLPPPPWVPLAGEAQPRARSSRGCTRLQHAPSDIPVSVCFALRPRCRCPPILAVVTVTPAPPTVLPSYRCRLLVLQSRSLRLPLSCVSGSPKCP